MVILIGERQCKLVSSKFNAFEGTGTWIFEPTDGKTKVKYQFRVRTNSLLFSVLSPFVNLEKGHSAEVKQVLKELNSYLLTQGKKELELGLTNQKSAV